MKHYTLCIIQHSLYILKLNTPETGKTVLNIYQITCSKYGIFILLNILVENRNTNKLLVKNIFIIKILNLITYCIEIDLFCIYHILLASHLLAASEVTENTELEDCLSKT